MQKLFLFTIIHKWSERRCVAYKLACVLNPHQTIYRII
jgi:hypothetical protein